MMTLLGILWPIYTITGFDASAHTSEETVNAAVNVPEGMLRSVAVSGVFGWVMVASFVLALPSVTDGAKQGANVFPWLMTSVLPGAVGNALWVGIVLANYLCGLACVTSTSRMMYAFRATAACRARRAQTRVDQMEDAGRRHLVDRRPGLRFDAVHAGVHHAHHRLRDFLYLSS